MKKKLSILLAVALATPVAFGQESKKEEQKESAAEQRAENRTGHEISKSAADRITGGPVIESVSDHSAVIAWSTNAKSSSVLTYGTDRRQLESESRGAMGRQTASCLFEEPSTEHDILFPRPLGRGARNWHGH
jgi:ATP-dependent 26S proteasome regulatory subunit